jgi:hypothetical protein
VYLIPFVGCWKCINYGNKIGKTAKRHGESCKNYLQPIINDFVDHWNEHEIDYYKKTFHDVYNLDILMRNVFVVPVHFAKEHTRMLAHAKKVLEYNGGSIAINPRFDKLITSLRTAVENGEGLLDKEVTSYDDIFDAFRMSLQFYH